MDYEIDFCHRCGERVEECTCTEDEIDEWFEEASHLCMCPYCPCGNTVTAPGEICGECRAGAHQG